MNSAVTVLQKLESIDSLPSPPQIAMEIIEICQDEEKGVGDLSKVLALDAAMASQILRIANSPAYRRGRDVSTIDQAVATLGTKSVSIVALGFSLKGAVPGWTHKSGLSDIHLWQHSVATAVASRQIARLTAFSEPEAAFLCGLLSRIGQQLLYNVAPEEYGQVIEASGGSLPTAQREFQQLGVTHNTVGKMLCEKWNLPTIVTNTIDKWSDEPSGESDALSICLAIVNAADAVAELLFSDDKAIGLGRLHSVGSESLQLSAGEVDRMFIACEMEIQETLAVFSVEPTTDIDCESILEAARHQLVQVSLGLAADLSQARDDAQTLEEANCGLQKAATTDPLTALPNRLALDAELKSLCQVRSQSDSRPYSIIMVDVDHFKSFNDTHGHVIGDEVLKSIGATLTHVARSTDFVARYGGEEFTVILTNVGHELAKTVAERYRAAIERRHVEVDDKSLSVTASLGVASSDTFDSAQNFEDVLKAADDALYAAKKGGRNQVVSFTEITVDAS